MSLLRYALPWLVAGVLIAVVLVGAIDGDDAPERAELAPVQETRLPDAVRAADCVFVRARPGQVLNPPVDGRSTQRPPRPGVYDKPLPVEALVAALRNGILVIHYRPGIDAGDLELLERVRAVLPQGTILVPNGTGMPYTVAVTAYRRLIGCPRVDDATVAAMRLFRGRYVGTGPDA